MAIIIPSQRIHAKRKGGLINEGGVISSEYGRLTSSIHKLLHYDHDVYDVFSTYKKVKCTCEGGRPGIHTAFHVAQVS